MQASDDVGDVPDGAATDQPAVGIVVGRDTVDSVLGVTVRARTRGYDVLVVPPLGADSSLVDAAVDAGAEVVVTTEEKSSLTGPRERLGSAARERGYPGMVFVDPVQSVPDIEESVARARESDEYAVNAVPGASLARDGVLVGIPAYNEAEVIGTVVREAAEHTDGVLVVDDGSDDETARRAREAGAFVVSHGTNRGYGAALKRIFDLADRWQVNSLVLIDGDGQHDPGDIPALLGRLDSEACNVVIGSRFGGESRHSVPLLRRIGLGVINTLTNVVLRTFNGQRWLSDTQSGFRAYDRTAVELLANEYSLGDGMEISIDSLFHVSKAHMTLEELPTKIDYDVDSASTHHPVIHGTGLVNNLLRIIETERPITFVGLPGSLSLLVGLSFGYWTVFDYIRTPDFALGLSVTATFFTLLGVFMVFTSIILHALNSQRARR
ncbi:glycosyltransferase family 2 protein [Natrinema salsiterrestre]|uniref:Glycosyltransferase family 2 protein n=1 Tax=Natrinema salsiterrestre TaxID=2950540 RepID=A0A9Q4L1G7_9EURY|nr:glycosyltransferase family 2 protein [Natrinema salsiterrestre]MDF9745839.1 glycosyltransferase family 2 protein [Natrinema salsiterrestre]